MGTELATRGGLDLTRAPGEQWNDEMVQLVTAQVLRSATTKGQVYYCLSLAEHLALNPFAGEIYFLPQKARDGQPAGVQPYVGREGLLKRANERQAAFETDVVHERDRFKVRKMGNGEKRVMHEYGQMKDRGEIVGAWCLLHTPEAPFPAYFYAELSEYLPEFDADWKMEKSPWGNQRAAMITKCAMMGAARQRINMGGVLMDAELDRVRQQRERPMIPGAAVEVPPEEQTFDWESLDAAEGVVDRLRAAVDRLNELMPGSWPPAKLQMVLGGQDPDALAVLADEIEHEAEIAVAAHPASSQESQSAGEPGGSSSGGDGPAEGVTEAEVVPDELPPEDRGRTLRARLDEINERLDDGPWDEAEEGALRAERASIETELNAAESEEQERLL